MDANSSPLNVLFLCNHNIGRSLMAEAVLNDIGAGRFRGYSGASNPDPSHKPHPLALVALESAGFSTTGLESKSWLQFAEPGAPHMDIIITVCDDAAREPCPVWPGHPAASHWSYPDPSLDQGSQAHQLDAFRRCLHAIKYRLELLTNLPASKLERAMLAASADELAEQGRG